MGVPKLNLKVVTPERVLHEGEIDQATLPTAMGQITVLPHHIPLVSNLVPGEIVIKHGQEEIFIVCDGGFVEVTPGGLVVLADAGQRADEVDEQIVEEAIKRAEQALAQAGTADPNYAVLRGKLDREMSRLRVARRYKQRGATRTGQSQ